MQVYAEEHRETQISNAEGIEYNMKSKLPGIKSEARLRPDWEQKFSITGDWRKSKKQGEKSVNKEKTRRNKEKSQCEIIHNL